MTTLYYIIGGVVIMYVLLETVGRFLNKSGLHKCVSDVGLYIDAYMRGGLHGTRIRLRDPATGRYVDFVKMMSKYFLSRYFMEVDSDKLSQAEFQRIQGIFDLRGIPYYLTSPLDPRAVKLIAHFDMDIDTATHAAKLVFYRVFGLTHDSPVRIACYGPLDISPRAFKGWDNHPQCDEYLEKYGRPDYERNLQVPPRENYLSPMPDDRATAGVNESEEGKN